MGGQQARWQTLGPVSHTVPSDPLLDKTYHGELSSTPESGSPPDRQLPRVAPTPTCSLRTWVTEHDPLREKEGKLDAKMHA